MRLFVSLGLAAWLMGCAAASTDESSASSAADLNATKMCGLDPTAPDSPRKLMNDPITSPDDAATRLGCLHDMLHAQHDGRAPFASLYSGITDAVGAAIRAGTFEDGAWAGRYLTNFAELYRVSFVGYVDGHGDSIPASWRISFDAAKNPETLIVQDVSLGVNAHVDRDLSHALVIVGIGDGATRDMRQRDHFRVNDILHENVEAALTTLAAVYAPGFGEAPQVVMDLLSATYFRAVEAGRLKAWFDAVALTDTPSLVRSGVEDEIELSSKLIADAILIPSLDPALLAKLHALEAGQL